MKSDYEVVTMDPMERQMWRHPLTGIVTVVFGCSIAAGLIYTFAFTDTSKETLEHALQSLSVIASLGLILAFIRRHEAKAIQPRWIRAFVWISVITAYVGFTVLFIAFPANRDPLVRLPIAIKLGSLGILPLLAWRLLKDKNS